MAIQLSEKYRPKTFEDFRGSDLVAKMLQRMVETESIPNCLLFSGPKGCGKTSMARILNLSLNKEETSSLSFIEVDAASNNGVDHVRSLQETIRYSHPGSWRVVVLDEALALDTLIPTPTGWETVESLEAGSEVMGADGTPTKVIRKTEVFYGKECFRVFFSDGTSMVTSANHKWLARRSGASHKMRVFTTAEMYGKGYKFRIPAAPAWDLPEASLPVSPYLFGLWLGDGSKSQLHISGVREDLEHYQNRLTAEGIATRIQDVPGKSAQRLTFSSSRTQWDEDPTSLHARRFRRGEWMNNKHIPDEFMRGSIQQREALLQGLMDSDGWVGEGGWCTFVGTERLCLDTQKLLTTLGIESSFSMVEDERASVGYGKLNFSARNGIMPASLPRKAARVKQVRVGGKNDMRTITKIEKVDSVPTQCIEVEAEDHLFLAGQGGHVTHNCHNLSTPAFNALLKVLEDPPNKTVFILITTKPETIPDTVKSRAMPFRFQRASENIIARRLAEVVVAEKLPITDPKVLLRMAKVSDGSLRTAMILLQQALLVEDLTEEAINFLSGYMVDTKDLMYAMLSGNLHEVEMELSNVFSESNDVEKMIISFSQTLKEFHAASLINNAQYLSSQTVIWNMRKILRGNDTVARTQLEAGLFALFAQNFWNGEEGSVEAPSNALTPEDISQLS